MSQFNNRGTIFYYCIENYNNRSIYLVVKIEYSNFAFIPKKIKL